MTNQSKVAGRSALKVILSAVLVIVLIVSTFTATAFAETVDMYDVKVIDNGQEIIITTDETEPIEILNTAGIALSTDDMVDITSFKQGEGGTIVINRLSTVNVRFDDTINAYGVYATTVGDALLELGLSVKSEDAINYSFDAPIENGMVISIDTAFSVSLSADGDTTKYAIIEGTVSDLLSLAGIELGADDYTKPSLETQLSAGMKVKVYRVTYAEITETEDIAFSTKKTNDSTLNQGTEKVIKNGVKGSKDVTYNVKYVNGKEAGREAISEVITKTPVSKEVKVGTKKVSTTANVKSNGVTSRNGYTVGQVISGRYTHYCACSRCCGKSDGVTASGKRVYNGMADPYYVACNWLPLGSVISVNGKNYTVVDRGGSGLSTRGRIDIYTPAGHQAALKGGTGSCTITIVRLGW
ncbi:MAG: G5 domain-containing protein [Eubacterium sp.]